MKQTRSGLCVRVGVVVCRQDRAWVVVFCSRGKRKRECASSRFSFPPFAFLSCGRTDDLRSSKQNKQQQPPMLPCLLCVTQFLFSFDSFLFLPAVIAPLKFKLRLCSLLDLRWSVVLFLFELSHPVSHVSLTFHCHHLPLVVLGGFIT